MIFCSGCGISNREGSRYCNHCGSRLVEDASTACPRCGVTNSAAMAHCHGCGLDLQRSGEQAEAQRAEQAAPPLEATQALAPRDAGLPPWLDSTEIPDQIVPRLAALVDLAALEAGRSAVEMQHGGWSPDAIPVEPIVGVPYRAREHGTLPPSSEQQTAAELFAQVAAEQVHTLPRDVPEPVRPTQLSAGAGHVVVLALLVALLVPMLWPALHGVGADAATPAPVAAAAKAIGALPPDAPVLVAFEYDAGLAGELQPVAEAYLRHLLSREARIMAVSTRPEGAALAEMALDRLVPARVAQRYEESFLNLGYVPGGEAAVRALSLSLAAATLAGYRHGAPAGGYPAMGEDLGARDLPLIVVIGRDTGAVQRWIEQAGAPFGTPLLAGVPAHAEPTLGPYWAAGQLHGLVAGVAGAAAYERLLGQQGQSGRMLASLRFGIWMVAGLVVFANLWALIGRLRSRRRP